jgi:hypothetical protein
MSQQNHKLQRRHFTPFVVSTDGLIGKEAKTFLKKLSSLLAEKWENPYSVVCGYVNAQVSISIVRATHRCLRGSRIPTSHMSHCRPQCEGKAGLGLFRHSSLTANLDCNAHCPLTYFLFMPMQYSCIHSS